MCETLSPVLQSKMPQAFPPEAEKTRAEVEGQVARILILDRERQTLDASTFSGGVDHTDTARAVRTRVEPWDHRSGPFAIRAGNELKPRCTHEDWWRCVRLEEKP